MIRTGQNRVQTRVKEYITRRRRDPLGKSVGPLGSDKETKEPHPMHGGILVQIETIRCHVRTFHGINTMTFSLKMGLLVKEDGELYLYLSTKNRI